MDLQLFALVDADNHDAIYCLGIDTGEGAITFRRDPDSGRAIFGTSTSMYTAFTRANHMMRQHAQLTLVIYEPALVAETIEYEDGKCFTCNNERTVPVDLDDIFPPDIAAHLEDTRPCPECTDEDGHVRQAAR